MRRVRTALELLAVYALLIGILWRVDPAGVAVPARSAVFGVLAVLVVLSSWRRRGATPAALGLAPAQWRNGWLPVAGASLLGVAALAAAGLALGSVSLGEARFSWIGDYALGLVAQQVLLQGFFAPGYDALAEELPPRRRAFVAIGAATLTFVSLHAPNPGLMIGVALAGAFWTAHFRRYRNLPAVLASHLVLGAAAMVSLGPGPLWNLRVGAGALELMSR